MIRPRSVRHVVSGLFALGMMTTSVFAQEYLKPESPARREMSVDNPYCGGQPSDIRFEIVEPIQFEGDPCPDGSRQILRSATFKVRLKWITSVSYFGIPAIQAEGSSSTNGDDKVFIEVNGANHWTIASIKRDGTDCLGTASPEGETGGGGGSWEGVKLTPPSSFESGEYGAGAGSDPREMTYTVKVLYLGNDDECRCSGFVVRGRYMHTYDGDVEFGCDNTVSVGLSFPWSVSVGGNFTFTNDHVWIKQLVDPTGSEHVRKIDPPPHFVPRQECCGSKSVAIPNLKVDEPVCVPTADPTVFIVQSTIYPATSTDMVHSIEMIARSPDGFEISRVSRVVETGGSACEVAFELTLPAFYSYDRFDIELVVIDHACSLDVSSGGAFAYVAASEPILSTELMGGEALVEGDVLGVGLRDPFASDEQAAAMTTAYVIACSGEIVDTERGVWTGDRQRPVKWGTVSGRESDIGDGCLGVMRSDTVVVEYRSETGTLVSAIKVIRDPSAILDCVVDQMPCIGSGYSGASDGGVLVFEIQPPVGDCRLVEIQTAPGMSAAKVTTTFIRVMRSHGLRFTSDAFGNLRLTNPTSTVRCRPIRIDAGLDLYANN